MDRSIKKPSDIFPSPMLKDTAPSLSLNFSSQFPINDNDLFPNACCLLPNNTELRNYLDNKFYTRIRKIKIELTLEGFQYIRRFLQQNCTTTIYTDTNDEYNSLLSNRAIMELLIEILDKLNKKMARLKLQMTITFTIPQAWALTELYLSIDATEMHPYTYATIQPIIDQFNQQLL